MGGAVSTTLGDGTGLVRITVVRGRRRADLAVPGVVSVADLLPELVASVGALDPYTVFGGYRLVRPDGVALMPDQGLTLQGVEDGNVLVVEVGVDDTPPRVYDDVIEAVADSIERQTRPWSDAASRRTALAVAGLVLGVAATALVLARDVGVPVLLATSVLSVLLLTAGAVLERGQEAHEVAVVVCWAAVVFAGVNAAVVGELVDDPGADLVVGGLAAALVAAVGVLALAEDRAALLPAVVLGGLVAGVGLVVLLAGAELRGVAVVAVALVVVTGSVVPWMSVATTRLRVPQPRTDADLLQDPGPLDGSEVDRQVRLGRSVLVAMTVTVGLSLVVAAPLLVGLGLAGYLVVLASAASLALRTRQYRDSVEVLVGIGAAAAAAVVATVAAVAVNEAWRVPLAAVLVVAGSVLLAVGSLPRGASVRTARLGDVAEGAVLVALLPLVVASLGLLPGTGG